MGSLIDVITSPVLWMADHWRFSLTFVFTIVGVSLAVWYAGLADRHGELICNIAASALVLALAVVSVGEVTWWQT